MDFQIVDTHCHLDFDKFNRDRDEVISRALENNISHIVNSGVSYNTNVSTLELSAKFEQVHPTMGLSPHLAARPDKYDIDAVISQIMQNVNNIKAIGEAGVDYHYYSDTIYKRKQLDAFKKIIDISKSTDLPLVVHARKGEREVFEMVHDLKCVVFHCYSGPIDLLEEIISNGHFISISSLVCFSSHHKKIAEETPLDSMVLETDSPYLSPRKNKRNEPVYIIDSLKLISRLHDQDEKNVALKTTRNACDIFNIK